MPFWLSAELLFFPWYLSIYPYSLWWSSLLLLLLLSLSLSLLLLLLFSCVFIHLSLFGFLLMLKCFSFGCLFLWFPLLFFMIYQWDQNMEYSFKKQVAAAATEYCARAQVQCYPNQSRWVFRFLYVCKARMNYEKTY